MKQWFTAAELAAMTLPGMPSNRTALLRFSERMGWNDPDRAWDAASNPKGIWRKRTGRGGGVEYHLSLLGADAQVKVMIVCGEAATGTEPAPAQRAALQSQQDWEWYDRQPAQAKAKAKEREDMLRQVEALVDHGHTRDVAVALVSSMGEKKVSPRSIWRWFSAVAGIDRHNWLPALAPAHAGGGAGAELEPDAWELFKADYLRLEAPTLSACYRRLQRSAEQHGWQLPHEKTIGRKIERTIHRTVLVLAREGLSALKATMPPMKRDRSHFHALEAINGDGHKWDVFVKFPDGTIGRPMMVALQDLYSNKMLAWRFDRSENKDAIRLALGDVVEQFGIPGKIYFDNTRAFANKALTAGAKWRFRFTIREEDPIGLCEAMGIGVHFTLPYSGQSKPIERSFRDMAGDIAKHPAFAGAYVGNSPMAKPENYGNAAVPFDDFVRIAGQEIHAWNAREGRRTDVAKGRSFDAVFAESYAANGTLIHQASEAMMRQWRLAAEGISAHRKDGSVKILDNTFWDGWLSQHAGEKLIVRFDPQNVHAGVSIYDTAERYLGFALVMEAKGFDDVAAAREHARQRALHMRAGKVMLEAERSMSALQMAKLLPAPPTSEPPETEHVVIQHVFRTNGSAALAAMEVTATEQAHDQDAFLASFQKGLSLVERDDNF
jgi:transposase InsO family protein